MTNVSLPDIPVFVSVGHLLTLRHVLANIPMLNKRRFVTHVHLEGPAYDVLGQNTHYLFQLRKVTSFYTSFLISSDIRYDL